MYNKNNGPVEIFTLTFKVIGFAFIFSILKYLATALFVIALIVIAYFLITEK